jgi:RNA polymerase sigma-70 factor (ECF subfamily)
MDKEKELLQAALEGGEGAQAEFAQMFRPRLLRASRVFLGEQHSEAEDMVQDTFLVAFPRLKLCDLSAPVYPWLRQICVRLCYARRRSRDGVLTCLEGELRAYMRRMNVQQVGSGHAEVQSQQKMQLLRELIKQLPPPGRQIIQLRNVHGMSYDQIAQVLGIPREAIVERLAEARGQIRNFVESPLAA